MNFLFDLYGTLADIKTVVSHAQALGHCADYIKKHGFTEQEYVNTALAAKYVAEKSGVGVKVTNFGYIQRGGSPNMLDRVLAARFGYKAVELLRDDQESCAIGIKDNKVITVPFSEVSKAEKKFDERLYEIAHVLNM